MKKYAVTIKVILEVESDDELTEKEAQAATLQAIGNAVQHVEDKMGFSHDRQDELSINFIAAEIARDDVAGCWTA